MTETEVKNRASSITGETDATTLSTYLDIAKDKIWNKAYPYKTYNSTYNLPEKYMNTALEIMVYLLNKRGAEGETYHSENGINRSYEKASIPESMLSGVIPTVGVI